MIAWHRLAAICQGLVLMAAAGIAHGDDAPQAAADSGSLEEIVVTGSRIQQRLEDAPRPVIILNRTDIERSAQDSIGKVLQQLPGNTGSPANTNVNNGGDGSTRVDLRGLGAERSLVLVNGRRFVSGGLGGDTSVDVNMIPLSMIERTEVLGVGSSTVYGADAVGGVVNLITRKNFHGLEVGGSYALSGEPDGDVAALHFIAGDTFDRGYFAFGGDTVDQAAVLQSARDYSARPEYLKKDGTFGPTGSTTLPEGLFTIPGDNVLGLPEGRYTRVTGSGDPATAADFRTFQNPADRYNFAPYNYLQTPSQRQSIWLQAGYDFSERLSFFVEALAHHRKSEQLLAATPYASDIDITGTPVLANGDTGIPASNWYNPFGVDLSGAYSARRRFLEAGGRHYSQDVDTHRFVAGLDGKVGAGWDWEFSVTYGRNDTAQTTEGELRTDHMRLALGPSGPDASGRIVCGARDPQTGIVPAQNVIAGCVPINIFGGLGPDGQGTITRDQLDYVTATLHDTGYNQQWVYDLLFHGDWGSIAGRPINWAVGATRREETAANQPDPAKLAGVAGGLVTSLARGGTFSANEVFAESQVPLLKGLMAAEELTLTAGVRLSDFSSFGSVTTYQGGLLYRPVRDVTFRAGYGRVFRAPPIAALYTSSAVAVDAPADPCGNDPTPAQQANCAAEGVPGGSYVEDPNLFVRTVVGGNPDLRPEEGDSISAGVTLAPSFARGFQLSVDYWRTALDNVIVLGPAAQDFVDACANTRAPDACSRIQRNADGSLRLVDTRNINASSLLVEGYDFDTAFTKSLGPGRFDARLMATYLVAADQKTFNGSTTIEAAGTHQIGAYPTWRGLGYFGYNVGSWSASYGLQYIGAMKEFVPRIRLPQAYSGWRRIDDVWYQDLNVAYRFDLGLTASFAIDNLGDVQPPFIATNSDANTDTATYRLLGRTYYLSLTYRLH